MCCVGLEGEVDGKELIRSQSFVGEGLASFHRDRVTGQSRTSLVAKLSEG